MSRAKAKAKPAKKPAKKGKKKPLTLRRRIWRWCWRGFAGGVLLIFLLVLAGAFINPPTTYYMLTEKRRLGDIDHEWVPMSQIAPVMARAAVAAEDANYCSHWGFDVEAIKAAIAEGSNRGASTISQQVVKNVYLWHGRSWLRKALEALITPMVEAVWSKERILEVYLNVAEFDEGVFGIEAASRHYFRVGPEELNATQAARLAAVLPSPKTRSASRPTEYLKKRTRQIVSGAATIREDGRAGCFQS